MSPASPPPPTLAARSPFPSLTLSPTTAAAPRSSPAPGRLPTPAAIPPPVCRLLPWWIPARLRSSAQPTAHSNVPLTPPRTIPPPQLLPTLAARSPLLTPTPLPPTTLEPTSFPHPRHPP